MEHRLGWTGTRPFEVPDMQACICSLQLEQRERETEGERERGGGGERVCSEIYSLFPPCSHLHPSLLFS